MITRVAEPELMLDADQVLAFDLANRIHGIDAFLYWFNFLKLKNASVLDLGCASGRYLIELQKHNPTVKFIGVDASEPMISLAKENIKNLGIENIEFKQYLFNELEPVNVDAIISTGTLHHVSDPIEFWKTIRRIKGENTPVLVMDIVRPETEEDLLKIVESARDQDPSFQNDLKNSLYAAYTANEVEEQLKSLGIDYKIYPLYDPIKGGLMFISFRN